MKECLKKFYGLEGKELLEDYLENIEKLDNLINIYKINYILTAKLTDIIQSETWLWCLKNFR